MSLPWFRFYSEAVDDRKIKVASAETGYSWMELFGAWAALLCAANNSPVRGALYVTLQKRFSNGDVTSLLNCDIEKSKIIIDKFRELDMIGGDNGDIIIINWEKRQYESDNSTKRVQKYRQKRKGNVSVTETKRFCNAPDTDTDTDTDTDKINNGSYNPYYNPKLLPLWVSITGMFDIPGDKERVITSFELIYKNYKNDDEFIADGRRYFMEWCSRKGKDGRQYSKQNCSWFYDWWVAGEIPEVAKSNGKPERMTDEETVADYLATIAKENNVNSVAS